MGRIFVICKFGLAKFSEVEFPEDFNEDEKVISVCTLTELKNVLKRNVEVWVYNLFDLLTECSILNKTDDYSKIQVALSKTLGVSSKIQSPFIIFYHTPFPDFSENLINLANEIDFSGLRPEKEKQKIRSQEKPEKQKAEMNSFPQSVIINILLQLPFPDLLNKCIVEKQFNEVCNLPHFWELKWKQDFPNIPKPENPKEEWKHLMERKYYPSLNLTNYTGKYKTYYPNGKLKSVMDYKNGKVDGKFIAYYKDGRIHYTSNLKHGERNGETIVYYTNGNLKEIANYVDNKLVGEVIQYYIIGGVKERKNYVLIGDKSHLIEANHYSTTGKLEITQFFDEDGNMRVFEYSTTGYPREVESKYDMTM